MRVRESSGETAQKRGFLACTKEIEGHAPYDFFNEHSESLAD